MNVLVNGIGNIGTTLINLLVDYRTEFGIDRIFALKNRTVEEWNRKELETLSERGVILCSRVGNGFMSFDTVKNDIHYVFDCTANTFGIKNKTWYNELPNLKGASAQGSEKGFGVPFMSGLNDAAIKGRKYVQIVSCNTHAVASLLQEFSKGKWDEIEEADFVIVRRSEDLGNHQRLVSANVVARHLSESFGTHHAIDLNYLLETIGVHVSIQSSDITTPSQLMHSVRFSVKLKESTANWPNQKVTPDQLVSITKKFDSNVIFELGRRYGKYGRIYSHAIINSNNMLLDEKQKTVKGWAFIPQEGNTILSTIHAFLLQCELPDSEKTIQRLKTDLVVTEW